MSPSALRQSSLYALASAGVVGVFIFLLLVISVVPGLGQLSVPALIKKPVHISNDVFPDEGFRKYVRSYIDQNGDDYLSNSEISAVRTIGNYDRETFKVTDYGLTGAQVSNLAGIEVFSNLETLVVQNSVVDELDLSCNPSLKYVDMRGNSSFAISYKSSNAGAQILVSENVDSWGDMTELNIVQA